MVKYREITDAISAEPFRPFGIHMADRPIFEVRYPEHVAIGRSSVVVMIYAVDSGEPVDRRVDLPIAEIERVSYLTLANP